MLNYVILVSRDIFFDRWLKIENSIIFAWAKNHRSCAVARNIQWKQRGLKPFLVINGEWRRGSSRLKQRGLGSELPAIVDFLGDFITKIAHLYFR